MQDSSGIVQDGVEFDDTDVELDTQGLESGNQRISGFGYRLCATEEAPGRSERL